ncbi:hypothetical protein GCM10019059_32990 [Camelimonas fluminis]|uniref:Uncharacterized protein n=1 Tax=Camelimonas fluminis TaxID=1576911 RepID=A0ABV7UFD3_9HYPH|nr:hypothetical protein [Camelimonas fluminis]GHE70639.1 hypothetical protein GCM10019059_32990 [Camelimonas fluminis]
MRAILRFLGFLAVVGGFVALVIDVTRYLANDAWAPARLQGALDAIVTDGGARLAASVSAMAGTMAGSAVTMALAAPASITGLIGGFLLMFIFRKPGRDETAPFQ